MNNYLKLFILPGLLILLNGNVGLQANPNNANVDGHVISEAFLITGSEDVADVALRGNDFGAWNYGRGIFLEAGYFVGLYDLHPGASLIRFNVSGLEVDAVSSAKLRIYKPKSMSQQGPVKVRVFRVSEANGDWVEGGSASQEERGASTWRMKKSGNKPWAGAAGCSKAGVDYELPTLGETQTVYPRTSGWIEFNLPAELVQSWIDNPEMNYGLYIRGQEDADLSDEAHFFSSEHPSGKGPQLIIKATPGPAKTEKQNWAWNPPKYMPPVTSPEYAKWKVVAGGRYKRWATGPEMHLSEEQGLWPYYWDTQIRINSRKECFIPLAKSLIRLRNYLEEGNQDALYNELVDVVRPHLLKYEDVKGMRIHQSGPVAEELTSIQLGTMLGKEGFGVHGDIEKYTPWKTEEEIQSKIEKEIDKITEKWEFSEDQRDTLEKYLSLYEGNRWYHGNWTGQYLREVQDMLETREESEELYRAARKLFYHHKLYVHWLSDFDTPKWNLWMHKIKGAAIKHVATDFLNSRSDNYRLEKYEEEIAEIREYYWYPPILYVNPVDEEVPEGGFGTREWPFKSVEEAVKVASNGTEIRVVGDIDENSITLLNKSLIIADGYNATFNMGPLDFAANAGPDIRAYAYGDSATISLVGSASTGAITSYSWSLDGSVIATGSNPTVKLPLGTHEIHLTVTNTAGATSEDVLIVSVETAPDEIRYEAEDAMYGPGNVKSGGTGRYVDLQSGGNIRWDIPVYESGSYNLVFNVAVPGGTRSMGVFVNGSKIGTVVTSNTTFSEFSDKRLTTFLEPDSAVIELRDSEGTQELNVDYLTVISVDSATSIEPAIGGPVTCTIFPNPFNTATNFAINIPEKYYNSELSINIYNILGQRVKTFERRIQKTGEYTFLWNAKTDLNIPLSTGIYFAVIRIQDFEKHMKISYLK